LVERARWFEGPITDIRLRYRKGRQGTEEKPPLHSWLGQSFGRHSGYDDAVRALSHPEALQRADKMEGVRTFDVRLAAELTA
jgi:hypothetical protein